MRHKQTDPFYSTGAWKKARAQALRRDHRECVWCRQAGRYTFDRQGRRIRVPADMVHHIKPRKEYPELELVLENLVSLCNSCHDEAHPEKFEEARKKPPTAAQRLGIRFEQL